MWYKGNKIIAKERKFRIFSHFIHMPTQRWYRQRFLNQEPLPIRAVRDPTPANIAKNISQSRKIKNSNNNISYNTITKGTCQGNNLIYYLECNWCHIKYVGQTKNRIIDRFLGHIFDIKHNNNITVARHFYSHNDYLDPNMTIHILVEINNNLLFRMIPWFMLKSIQPPVGIKPNASQLLVECPNH